MKIERNGVEYELTSEELLHAYWEQEHLYDIDDVKSELELVVDNDIDEAEYIEAAKRIYEDSDKLDSVARSKRRNIDRYNMEWNFAVSEAVKDAIQEEMEAYSA